MRNPGFKEGRERKKGCSDVTTRLMLAQSKGTKKRKIQMRINEKKERENEERERGKRNIDKESESANI